jgi:hypothetical protein
MGVAGHPLDRKNNNKKKNSKIGFALGGGSATPRSAGLAVGATTQMAYGGGSATPRAKWKKQILEGLALGGGYRPREFFFNF